MTDVLVITPMTETEARECADKIKTGMQDIYRLLLELHERNGWRALGYSSWLGCAQAEFGYSASHTYRLLESAEIRRNIFSPVGENMLQPIPERQLRPLTQLPPEAQPVVWQRAVETAPGGKVTAAHVQAVVDDYREKPTRQIKPENLHVSDDSYEWFTPSEYIEAARRVMGRIDTDPASCTAANAVVKAHAFYTVEDDGLLHDWAGNVWLNPPYNMPWIERFVDKAIAEYDADQTRSVIVLTNNSTDTAWFHRLLGRGPVCLTRGRIRFWGAEGDILATRQGQAIFYLGSNRKAFVKEFAQFGAVVDLI